MKADAWFVGIGILALLAAVFVALGAYRRRCRKDWLAALFWVVFAAGLLVQAFAPRLRVEHNAFVVPESMARGRALDPVTIVNRERQMQTLSALLVVAGAAGLAWFYRRAFLPERAPENA